MPTSTAVKCSPVNQAKFDAFTMLWIHKNLRPYSLVEDKGLQDLISFASTIQGEAEICSSHALRASSLKLGNYCDERIRVLVKEEILYYSLCVDLWQSSLAPSQTYIAISIHYCNSDFVTKSFALRASTLPENSSGESIADLLGQTSESWGLPATKLVMLMRGNGASLPHACGGLGC